MNVWFWSAIARLGYLGIGISMLIMPMPGEAADCAPPDPEGSPLVYSLREDGRCEGYRERIPVDGSLDLIGFMGLVEGEFGNQIQIRVPRRDSTLPTFEMLELLTYYGLRAIPFSRQGDFYLHTLDTEYLREGNITRLEQLQAISYTSGAPNTYFPTFLGRNSQGYGFTFYSVETVGFVRAEIRSGDRAYATWGRQDSRSGSIIFKWREARNAPSGRYVFSYEANLEQRNRPPERITRSIVFWHDPDWLR